MITISNINIIFSKCLQMWYTFCNLFIFSDTGLLIGKVTVSVSLSKMKFPTISKQSTFKYLWTNYSKIVPYYRVNNFKQWLVIPSRDPLLYLKSTSPSLFNHWFLIIDHKIIIICYILYLISTIYGFQYSNKHYFVRRLETFLFGTILTIFIQVQCVNIEEGRA